MSAQSWLDSKAGLIKWRNASFQNVASPQSQFSSSVSHEVNIVQRILCGAQWKWWWVSEWREKSKKAPSLSLLQSLSLTGHPLGIESVTLKENKLAKLRKHPSRVNFGSKKFGPKSPNPSLPPQCLLWIYWAWSDHVLGAAEIWAEVLWQIMWWLTFLRDNLCDRLVECDDVRAVQLFPPSRATPLSHHCPLQTPDTCLQIQSSATPDVSKIYPLYGHWELQKYWKEKNAWIRLQHPIRSSRMKIKRESCRLQL